MGTYKRLRILGALWEAKRAMNFTVVRAVRGSDLSTSACSEGFRRVSQLPTSTSSPAPMDLPYAGEVLHLEITDFPKTIPGSLE